MKLTELAVSLFLTSVMVAPFNAAKADDAVRQYGIKQSAPTVGTNFTREILKVGPIPLNKHFDELTEEQKAILRAEYDHMPDADEPPFPVKGLIAIYKPIARVHESLALEYLGPVTAYVSVDSEGNPKSVEVPTSPSSEITDVVRTALMTAKYKPALCGGQPCAMQMAIHAELVSPAQISPTGGTAGLQVKIRDN